MKPFEREDGVTLVELITVVSLLGVILGFVTGSLVSIQNASVGESYRLQNLEEARILMDADDQGSPDGGAAVVDHLAVRRDRACRLRGSGTPPRTPATPRCGSTRTSPCTAGNPTPCPDVVHLYVDTAANPPVLKEQIAGRGRRRNAADLHLYRDLHDAAGRQVHREPDDLARCSPTTTTTQRERPRRSRVPRTPLIAANRLLVNAVGVRLSIRQSTNYTVPYTTLVNRVRLPNVDYNPIPQHVSRRGEPRR